MKRLLCAIGIVAVAAGVIALFFVSPGGPTDGRVVRFLDGPDVGGGWKEVIQAFHRAHPDIRVELEEGPASTNQREDMYTTAFSSGVATYDLAYMDVIWVPKFASAGWVAPLDDRLSEEARKEYLPGDLAGGTWQGRVYRLPVRSDAGMLYYRKDLLEAAGEKPPETWDDLERIASKLARPPSMNGFVFQGKQYEGLICAFLEHVWGAGGELIDADGKVRIDEEPAVAALTWLVSLVREKKIAPEAVTTYGEEEVRKAFQEEQAVFMRNWPYAWKHLGAEDSRVRGKVGICPMVHRAGGKSAATLGGWGFGLARTARDPEAAWTFARFASGPEGQKILHRKNGALPSRHSLYQDADLLAAAPHLADLYRVLLGARPRPVHPRYSRISDILQVHVSSALVGSASPREALSKAAAEIRSALAEAGAK
ncbi:MAG: ABC transporter substrate-binding protein [Planctomycetota bacterium]